MDGAVASPAAPAGDTDQAPDPLAAPLPVLRDDLDITQGAAQQSGAPAWVIFDPIAARYFEIGRETLDMLTVWRSGTVGDLMRRMRLQFDRDVSPEDVAEVIHFLMSNALVRDIMGNDYRSMAAKVASEKKSWASTAMHSYLFFRIPLFRPDRFLQRTYPFVAPLFSRVAVALYAIVGLLGLYLVSRQWEHFTGTFQFMLSWNGIALYGLSLVIVKSLHELGHAFMSVRYGLRVPTIGIAFMVLMPVLYTDTSGAWRLRSRRQRLMIDGAGIFTELALAAGATLLWAFLPDGGLRLTVFAIATTSWVTSLAVNLNPLMRFDGYYILSDWLGFQNLQSRGFAMARWRLRELLFGLGEEPPERLTRSMRRTVIIHAWATWIYRFFLFLGIAILVYAFFIKVIGILLFIVEIVWFIALPIWREMRHWWSIRSTIMKSKRILSTGAVLAALGVAAIVPWSTQIAVPAFVTAGQEQRVFAPLPSRIERIAIREGATVAKGDVLFVLAQPQLVKDLAAVREKAALLSGRIDRSGADATDRASLVVLENELRQAYEEEIGLSRHIEALTVRAAFDGIVTDLDPELHSGLWTGSKSPLAILQSPSTLRVKGYVSERDISRLSPGASAVFVPENPDLPRMDASVTSVAQTATDQLDEPYLALPFGGAVATQEASGEELRPTEAIYSVAMALPADTKRPAQAVRGTSLIEGRAESFFTRAKRGVLRVFIRELGV